MSSRFSIFLFVAFMTLLLAVTPSGFAADFTWNGSGTNNNFSEGNNWGGVAPASANTNTLIFDGSTRLSPNVDIVDPFVLNELSFAATAGAFTIGGNDLQFDAISADLIQNSASNQTINSTLRIVNNDLTISGTGAGSLTFAEVKNYTAGRKLNIYRSASITSLTANGTAPLVDLAFGGFQNTTLTLGSLTAGSGGYGALNVAFSTFVNRLDVTSSGSYGFSSMLTDTFTFGGSANVTWTVGAAGWSFNGNAAKTETFVDAGTKVFDSDLYLSNNLTNSRQITFDVSGGDVTLNGQIRDTNAGSGAGTNGLIKTGSGNLILANVSENSDFTGAVNINQGTVIVTANNALGTIAGSTTVASGAALGFQGDVDYSTTETLSVAGNGVGSAGALRNLSGTNSFAGAIGLAAATTLGSDAGTLTLSGSLTGAQNVTKVGAGTVALSNASNVLGTVSITAGTLESRAQGAIGTTAPTIGSSGTLLFSTVDQNLTYGSTTFGASTSTINVATGRTATLSNSTAHSATGFTKTGGGILELDGSKGFFGGGPSANQTVRVNEGTLVANRSGNLIAGTSAIDATSLIIGDGVNTATFQNKAASPFQISASSAVTINANGTLDTNGVDGTLGNVTMNGGAITTGAGRVTLSGAASAFTYGGNSTATISGLLRLKEAVITNFAIADGTAATDVSISASIDNIISPATLQKTGAGTLELTASSAYTGTTQVNVGTLLVNNGGGSATGSSTVMVAAGATLGGSGKISGPTEISGILAPGNSLGTIEILNDVTWNANNAWKFELGGAAASLAAANAGSSTQDLLSISNTSSFLKGSGSGWSFDFQNLGTNGWYKIVDWDDSTDFLASDFSALNLAGSLTGNFVVDAPTSALYLEVVPEPGTMALLLTGLSWTLLLRRRRQRD